MAVAWVVSQPRTLLSDPFPKLLSLPRILAVLGLFAYSKFFFAFAVSASLVRVSWCAAPPPRKASMGRESGRRRNRREVLYKLTNCGKGGVERRPMTDEEIQGFIEGIHKSRKNDFGLVKMSMKPIHFY